MRKKPRETKYNLNFCFLQTFLMVKIKTFIFKPIAQSEYLNQEPHFDIFFIVSTWKSLTVNHRNTDFSFCCNSVSFHEAC